MDSQDINSSKDVPFSAHASWFCKAPERQLVDVLRPVSLSGTTDLTQVHSETPRDTDPVFLEQGEDASACLLKLRSTSDCPALICSVLVVSEARTMEVYSGTGEYSGTCRGEPDRDLQPGGADGSISFYKKHVKLESPGTSCDVKLLSLGGRNSVGIGRILLGIQVGEAADMFPGASIDLRRVQSMMESMGSTLSPGAQSLMDMVQFQQKSKMDILGGFLPLLLGGGSLASMPKGGAASQAETADGSSAPMWGGSLSAVPELRPAPPPETLPPPVGTGTDHRSACLNGQPGLGPDLLPMLQSVCGQVAQLRLDGSASKAPAPTEPKQEHSCCRSLEQAVERRLEEMEGRLMQRIDQRLEALQQSLQSSLWAALAVAPVPQGAKEAAPDCLNGPGLLNGES